MTRAPEVKHLDERSDLPDKPIKAPATRMPRQRLTLKRLMVAVAASAVVLAVLDIFQVPAIEGTVYGGIACLAIVGVAALANDTWDLGSALAAVAVGLLIGAPAVQDACAPIGIFIGPVLGYITRITTRRRAAPVPRFSVVGKGGRHPPYDN